MNIYADTSWLVSLLYPGDTHHADALTYFRAHAQDQWLTSDWSRFETVNALRNLCLAKPGPAPAVMEAIRRLWKHWHEQGPFEHWKDAVWPEALAECQQLSAAYATGLRMRSADVLHVALLDQMDCDLFVTRDKDQHALASRIGFPCHLAT